ncbi:hypothetical protein V8F33_009198 [Rhypophila sp. PSN 637]
MTLTCPSVATTHKGHGFVQPTETQKLHHPIKFSRFLSRDRNGEVESRRKPISENEKAKFDGSTSHFLRFPASSAPSAPELNRVRQTIFKFSRRKEPNTITNLAVCSLCANMDFSQPSFDGSINPGDPPRQPLQDITPAIHLRYVSDTPFMDNCTAVLKNTTKAQAQERATKAKHYQNLFRSHYTLSVSALKDLRNSDEERNRTRPGRHCGPSMPVGSFVTSVGYMAPNHGEHNGRWHASTVEHKDQLSFIIYEDTSNLWHNLPTRPAVTSNQSHCVEQDDQIRDTDMEMPDSCADTEPVPGSDSTVSVEDLRI